MVLISEITEFKFYFLWVTTGALFGSGSQALSGASTGYGSTFTHIINFKKVFLRFDSVNIFVY